MKKTLTAAVIAAAPLAAVMSTAPAHAVDLPVGSEALSAPSHIPADGLTDAAPGADTLTDSATGLLGGLPVG